MQMHTWHELTWTCRPSEENGHLKVQPTLAGRSSSAAQRRSTVVAAASAPYVGSLVGTGLKVGVVVARFNDLVTKPLLEGALEAFSRHGVSQDDVDVRALAYWLAPLACKPVPRLCSWWGACGIKGLQGGG